MLFTVGNDELKFLQDNIKKRMQWAKISCKYIITKYVIGHFSFSWSPKLWKSRQWNLKDPIYLELCVTARCARKKVTCLFKNKM